METEEDDEDEIDVVKTSENDVERIELSLIDGERRNEQEEELYSTFNQVLCFHLLYCLPRKVSNGSFVISAIR